MKNGLKIDQFGNKRYYLNNILHRKDGPAIEYADGYKEWYVNGLLHREDGPAVEFAGEYAIKYTSWWYQGKFINCKSQEEFEIWLRRENLKAFW